MAQVYDMRAWHTVLTEMVYWTVIGDTPDFAGVESGYTPGDLTHISVVREDVEGTAGPSKIIFTRIEDVSITSPAPPGSISQGTLQSPDVYSLPFDMITPDP